jgi:hypothetical protein
MTTATEPGPPLLRLAHRADRRLRLKLAEPPPGGDALQAFVDRLAGTRGVRRARLRPTTGSVILDLALPAGEVLAALETAGVARLAPPPPTVPVGVAVEATLAQADAGLSRATDGALDLRTALGLALAGAAVVQLARGRVAGPATTLGMAAWSLLARRET